MRPLFLHIGIHRTGTTSLQKLLAANRARLQEMGYRYAFEDENHTWAASQIMEGRLRAADFVRRLEDEARAHPDCELIVSGEDFARLKNVGALQSLRDHFQVHVIVYLRRQDQWLESWYNQHVKWPWSPQFSTASPHVFFNHINEFHWLDYRSLLQRWATVFGRGSLLVGVFEKDQIEGSLAQDFCRRIGIDHERLEPVKEHVNASVPAPAIEFLRHLDLLDKAPPCRQILINAVTDAFQRCGLDQERHFISGRQRRAILAHFEAGNRAVARDYLGRLDGRLFLAEWPADDPREPALDLPAVPELSRQVIQPVVRDILKRIATVERGGNAQTVYERAIDGLDRRHARLLARHRKLQAMAASPRALLSRLGRLLSPSRKQDRNHG